jgi:hypothetical protein
MKKFALLSMLLGLGLFVVGCDSKPAPKAKPPAGGGGAMSTTTGGESGAAADPKEGEGEMDADHEHKEGETHEGDEPKADGGATDPIEGDAGVEPKADAGDEGATEEEKPE